MIFTSHIYLLKNSSKKLPMIRFFIIQIFIKQEDLNEVY